MNCVKKACSRRTARAGRATGKVLEGGGMQLGGHEGRVWFGTLRQVKRTSVVRRRSRQQSTYSSQNGRSVLVVRDADGNVIRALATSRRAGAITRHLARRRIGEDLAAIDLWPDLDLDRIRHWLPEFGSILETPELHEDFERLLRQRRKARALRRCAISAGSKSTSRRRPLPARRSARALRSVCGAGRRAAERRRSGSGGGTRRRIRRR